MTNTKFDLSKYEMVKDRLPKFLAGEKYKNPRVITQLMSPIDKIEKVVFMASLYDGETLLATGWAYEVEGDGYINQTSHLENCETSAIGRALANLGLQGTADRPSQEEMQKVQRMQQQPQKPTEKSKAFYDEKYKRQADRIKSAMSIAELNKIASYMDTQDYGEYNALLRGMLKDRRLEVSTPKKDEIPF